MIILYRGKSKPPRIDPDKVFAAVTQSSHLPFISIASIPAPFQFETTQTLGYIDRIDAENHRVTGQMINGQFVPAKL